MDLDNNLSKPAKDVWIFEQLSEWWVRKNVYTNPGDWESFENKSSSEVSISGKGCQKSANFESKYFLNGPQIFSFKSHFFG